MYVSYEIAFEIPDVQENPVTGAFKYRTNPLSPGSIEIIVADKKINSVVGDVGHTGFRRAGGQGSHSRARLAL